MVNPGPRDRKSGEQIRTVGECSGGDVFQGNKRVRKDRRWHLAVWKE